MKDILVIGESCRDVFVYCNATRLCPDVPVPVLGVVRQAENPGMAKNVQRNIHQIVKKCDIVTNTNWEQITKTRYIHADTNHMFVRIDTDHSIIKRINVKKLNFRNYKIIVIADYNKGFLTESDIEYICTHHSNVFLDTKKILGTWAELAKYIKINNFEYENSKKYLTPTLLDKLIHTKGGDGCIYKNTIYPVKRVEVKDSSGAGDSFMSGLVCNYLKTSNIIKSIKFANKCAEKVVQHIGVTTI
jgi:D-beta-D-heptose 7-phosphate kinase/D-beta-D-heptose 1-phosphate adenosyltransferase